MITFDICGSEKISITNEILELDLSIDQINETVEFKERFSSSKVNCQVNKYELLDYTDDDITIDGNNDLVIQREKAMEKIVIIQASSAFGSQHANLTVKIRVSIQS